MYAYNTEHTFSNDGSQDEQILCCCTYQELYSFPLYPINGIHDVHYAWMVCKHLLIVIDYHFIYSTLQHGPYLTHEKLVLYLDDKCVNHYAVKVQTAIFSLQGIV